MEEYFALPLCRSLIVSSLVVPNVSAAEYKYKTMPGLILHFGNKMAFRFKEGALVIQLPSGSMPTISLCACWLICRIIGFPVSIRHPVFRFDLYFLIDFILEYFFQFLNRHMIKYYPSKLLKPIGLTKILMGRRKGTCKQ